MNPLFLDFTASAQAELTVAGEHIRHYSGDDAAEVFAGRIAETIGKALIRLAEEVADGENGKPFQPVDEVASIRWSQPVYRMSVETVTKRRRGSSAGLWYIYYSLRNRGANMGTDKPDTMLIHALRHSASRPLELNEE